ncbi:UvrD-helicase domain-containing protein [Lactococcus lactis]
MKFSDEEIYEVESVLLGDNHFNESQQKFLNLFNDSMIVAGPGAGKTTTLSAKIALMLKNINKKNTGETICIITHTNVAVDEIKVVLNKVGIVIERPHFIGTIHSFLNTFCLEPYFRNQIGITDLIFLDEDAYMKINEGYFKQELLKYMHLNKNVLNNVLKRLLKSRLELDKFGNKIVTNKDNWEKLYKYSDVFLKILVRRKAEGILTMDDSFFFADMFLKNEKWAAILRRKFDFLLVDEFQDTSSWGFKCLSKIFLSSSNPRQPVIQFIGDFNQSIYHLQEEASPLKESITLDTTNRFGNEIMQMLSNVFSTEPMQTLDSNRSYKPIVLIYSNESEIIPTYHKILQILDKHSDFKNNNKKDKILVRRKKLTERLVNNGTYSQNKMSKLQFSNHEASKMLIKFIENKILSKKEDTILEVRKVMTQNNTRLSINKILIEYLKKDTDECNKYLVSSINKLLKEFNAGQINKKNNIIKDLTNLFSSLEKVENSSVDVSKIFTIHSVKGETHRSTLVADIAFESSRPYVSFLDVLKISYGELKSSNTELEREARNLLYVALSRAKYLVVLSISENELTSELKEKMERDWKLVSTQRFIEDAEESHFLDEREM